MNSTNSELAPTNVRVSTRTVQAGDIVRTGYGTLNIIDREVVMVRTWFYNGYVNADLTFSDGTVETMWDGAYWDAIR